MSAALLNRSKVEQLPRVKQFLNAMAVNSEETKQAYLSALVHFNTFLVGRTQTADSIVTEMLRPKADVYVILQGFVSYLAPMKLAPSSKRGFVRAVRSYFGFQGIDIIPAKFKARVKMFKVPKGQGEALDIETIRIILNNRHDSSANNVACISFICKVYIIRCY